MLSLRVIIVRTCVILCGSFTSQKVPNVDSQVIHLCMDTSQNGDTPKRRQSNLSKTHACPRFGLIFRRFGYNQNGDKLKTATNSRRRHTKTLHVARRFDVSPFWICRRFGSVAVLDCRRFDWYPYVLSGCANHCTATCLHSSRGR